MRFLPFLAIFTLSLIMTSCASTLEEELDERAMDLQIRNVMQSRRTDFEECYAITVRKLKESQPKKPALHGEFQLALGIGPLGGVLDTNVVPETNTLKNREIENCVSGIVRAMQFGKLGEYDRYQVTYPFQFN